MADQVTWISNVARIVIDQVPLQSLDSAVALVEAYLSNIGGWVPDDQGNPNGEGHPANSFTEQQSADAITENSFNAVYDVSVRATVVVDVQVIAKLSTSLSLDAAGTAMSNQIAAFLTNQINDSDLPIRVESVETSDVVAFDVADLDDRELDQLAVISDQSSFDAYDPATGESTTADIRQIIADDLAGADKVIDYKVIALDYATSTYGLDDTWNVVSVYTETNQPIVVQIRKYTDETYATLDEDRTTIYVISISPDTYFVVSGVVLN